MVGVISTAKTAVCRFVGGFLGVIASFLGAIGLLPDSMIRGGVDRARRKIFNYDASYNKTKLEDSLQHDNAALTDIFYDLVTDFYEWGWGQSFHFSTRFKGESFNEAILRHEYILAHKLGIKKTDKVLDAGCGVGGPARNVSKHTGCTVTGITINDYQVKRATRLTPRWLKKRVSYKKANYADLPFADESFDKCFFIEATCHMKDRTKPFGEAFRVLKPGGLMLSYEWLMTDKFDPKNRDHLRIKRGIEHGNGLPDTLSIPEMKKMCTQVGFEIVEAYDMVTFAEESYAEDNIPWQHALSAGTDLITGFLRSTHGRYFTRTMLNILETIGFAPKGSIATSDMLEDAAVSLIEGGETGIFTPMYVIVARKPLK